MTTKNIEDKRLEFDREKFDRELILREKELILKEIEIANGRSKFTPTKLAFWGALIGLLGTVLGVVLQGYSNQSIEKVRLESSLKLERQKFESEIVLKIATSDSLEQNKRNLKFMIDAGFINDDQGKIQKLVDSSFNLKVENPYSAMNYENELPPEVFICLDNTSKAYHKEFCRALSRCADKIQVIQIKQAKELGRLPCAYCFGSF